MGTILEQQIKNYKTKGKVMFRGIGNDIVEIERIRLAIERNSKFRDRVFTPKEILAITKKNNPYPGYAGRFAAKEAVAKALGTGIRGFRLKDIEILSDELGKPEVTLRGSLAPKYKNHKVELSISHSRDYATAVALLLEERAVEQGGIYD